MQRQMLATSALVTMAADTAATASKEPTMVAKLSIKTMGAEGVIAKLYDERVPLVRFLGVATGIKVAEGQDGSPVFGLKGMFRGKNIKTGQEFVSGVCYLPAGIGDAYIETLQAALEADKSASMRVGVDVFAVKATNKAGYSFEADSIIPMSIADPLRELMEAGAKAALPALPKPTDEKAK